MNAETLSTHSGGGQAEHAGNLFHYLYAATRVMELLEPDQHVHTVRLEGQFDVPDEQILDVVVEGDSEAELIQVKWSATSRRLAPKDFWHIAERLWSNARRVGSRGYRPRMLVYTNRQLSPELQRQWEVLQRWKNLSQEQSVSVFAEDGDDPTIIEIRKTLNSLTGRDTKDLVAFVQSVNINHSLGSGAIDDKRSYLDLQLRAVGLPPEKYNTRVLDLVIDYCQPENARKAITVHTLMQVLGLSSGPKLRHDVELPDGYTEWNALGDELNKQISELAANGGIAIVLGSPGSGKTVQLQTWAKGKRYPFYACRLGDRYDDIPVRVNQTKFLTEMNSLIRQRYRDRISESYHHVEGVVSGATSSQVGDSLTHLLDALGAASNPSEPGVLLIDGLDDAYRWDATGSFLSSLRLPPPGVVLVVSAQGQEFLPVWMRSPSDRIVHVPVTLFPDELGRKVALKLLLSAQDKTNQSVSNELNSIVEQVVRLSAGNLLVLRTICTRLCQEDPPRWQSILDSAGDEPFKGIDSYFSKVLGSPSPDELRCLKTLAISRIPLTADQVTQVTQCRIEDLQSALMRLRFILNTSGESPRRYSLYNISLRRYIEKNLFEADQSRYHETLSRLFMKQQTDLDAATEIPYHLLKAERLEDVVKYVTFEYLDRLFNELIPPSRIEEQMVFLASAASRLGGLGEAFRAGLLATKVDQRLDFLTPPGRDTIDGSTTEFEIILEVLASGSDELMRCKAIDVLREVQNPERRYDIAVRLALRAFRSSDIDFAQSALQVARNVMLFYHAPRSPETAKNEAACSVWSDKKLIDIYAELKSAEWVRREHDGQEQEPLPLSEQYKLRGDTLRSMAFEAVKANRDTELHEIVERAARVYKTYLLLGMCEAQEPLNPMDVKYLVEEGHKARYLTPEERIKIASLFLKTNDDIKEAFKISHLRTRQLSVVDTQGASLPEHVSEFSSFLNELRLRVRLGDDFELSYENIREGDSQKAAQYFCNAAIALFIAETIKEGNKSKSVVVEKIEATCEAWEFERPYSMWWTPFLDARRQLRLITYRLIRLAFNVDEEMGIRVGQRIWSLKGWAIGTLDLDTKLDILIRLKDIVCARSWIVNELESCVKEIKSNVRDTNQRVSLFLKSANAYRSRGMLEKARELVSDAVICTKGLPEVHEEPRYHACLILGEALLKRGQAVLPSLKRLGRCIDGSYEASGNRYVGYSWPWLVEAFSIAELSSGLSLAAELDDESVRDEYLPDIQTSLRRIIIQEGLNISPEQWMALFWIVGGVTDDRPPHRDKDIEDIVNSVLAACTSEPTRQRMKMWIDSLRDGKSKKGESESSSHKGELNSLILASKTGLPEKLWQEAIGGSGEAIHTILEHLSGWLPQKNADHSLDFDLKRMLENFLVDSVPYCYSSDISQIRKLYRSCRGISYEAPLLMRMACREMTQDPQKAKELLLAAIDGSYWDGSALLAEELRLLTEIDSGVSRYQIAERIAWRNKTFTPLYIAITLIELPDSLVSSEDLHEIYDVLCSDIEDSLSILPPRPVRAAFVDSYSPPISNVSELVRHLLHNRNKEVRQRSLEAVGILAIEGVEGLVPVFCSQDGIDRLPVYLQLTAEQQRLAALWVLAEIDAKPLGPLVDDIFNRYVKDNAACGEHFLMFEYGRQICIRILETGDTSELTGSMPTYDIPLGQPGKLVHFTEEFHQGSVFLLPLGLIDRELEYDFELLAQMFRIRARVLERAVNRIKARIGALSEEERQLDRWIIDQQYTRNSRPIITAREELVRHAYRILQQWCFLHRPADVNLLEEEGIARFERREIDPWLPRLFTSIVCLPFGPPQSNCDGEGDKWFQADLPDLTSHIDAEGSIVVHEYVTEGKAIWQMVCSVESCLINKNLEKQWLNEGDLKPVHSDFPSYIYMREVAEDFNWWWQRWNYGAMNEGVECNVCAYAVDRLGITEPYYVTVSRPLPLLANNIELERRTYGYDICDRSTHSILWVNQCIDSNEVRVLATKDWIVGRLRELGLLLAIEIRVRKEQRRKESWGYGLEQDRHLVLKCVMDHQGDIKWGRTRVDAHEYSRTSS
jgi:archaellum biogenesis ATPase FlaH